MAEVIWSPKALDQVDAIAEYIANDSPFYAKQVVTRILVATRRLESFPERYSTRKPREIPFRNGWWASSFGRIVITTSTSSERPIPEDVLVPVAQLHGCHPLGDVECPRGWP